MSYFLNEDAQYQLDPATAYDLGRDAWKILVSSLQNQGKLPNYRRHWDGDWKTHEPDQIPYFSNYYVIERETYEYSLCTLLASLNLFRIGPVYTDNKERTLVLFYATPSGWRLALGLEFFGMDPAKGE